MVFKAKYGKRQIFSFDGMMYRAVNGKFETSNKSMIEVLSKSSNWETETENKVIEKEEVVISEVEEIKPKKKAKSKKKDNK